MPVTANSTPVTAAKCARSKAGTLGLLASLLMCSACRSPYYADQGAALGGLTGAGVGAAIGNAHGNTAAGALLGTAVGAMTGGVVGNELDNIRAENQAMIDARLAQRRSGAATLADISRMARAGLSDDVIVNHVRTRGVARPLSTEDLIAAKNAGVSDSVIRSMQEMSAVPPPPSAQPVVVEEHYYAAPRPYWGPRFGYYDYGWHHPHRFVHRHRPGVSWGISVAH